MKIEWEEIYNNIHIENKTHLEATYRARVYGGWLIRHETLCDYHYENDHDVEDQKLLHRYIHEEGYQNVKNNIIFVPDRNHFWK